MAKIKDLLAFLLLQYPYTEELSKTRTTKMIYLCDWRHCLTNNSQITEITWVFDNFGPFVWDVMDEVKANPDLFSMTRTTTIFGTDKLVLGLKDRNYKPLLTAEETKTAIFVINATKDLSMDAFVKLIYSTYPILTAERGDELDLLSCARQYKGSAVFKSKFVETA